MATERDYISQFRTAVERKLVLGGTDGKLRQRDFEYLASVIEENTKVRLSLSTLKRLWKDDYTQEPHPSTLDALASLLGFDSWQSFKKSHQAEAQPVITTSLPRMRKSAIAVPLAVTMVIVLLVAGFLLLQGFNSSEKKLVLPDDIVFKADKTVTSGVPNTVLFTYDVKGIKADSFFIQQSWNPLNKVRIDPDKNYLSSIYYLPGFHRAKLIVNDSIVRRAMIHIKTDGWMPIVQYDVRDNKPFYLDKQKMFIDGKMVTTPDALKSANIDVNGRFILKYYNIRDFDGVNSDNFSVETRLKHDSTGTSLCPVAELTVLTEEHIFYIQLTSMGCVGDIGVKIGEVEKSSRDFNLSGLGTEVHRWQKLQLNVRNKHATILLNDKEVLQMTFTRDFGSIVGLVHTFNGTGSVDYVKMNDGDGRLVYEEEFLQLPSSLISQ
jgi:hypothetical protein